MATKKALPATTAPIVPAAGGAAGALSGREAMAVTGYVATERLEGLGAGGPIEIWPERDVAEVYMRVQAGDVEQRRVGATQSGKVLVQLILRQGASVETVVVARTDRAGMKAYNDPVINRIRQEAVAKRIVV